MFVFLGVQLSLVPVLGFVFAHSYISTTKQFQENVKDKSRTVVGNEFQAAEPEAAKLRDQYRGSRERGIYSLPMSPNE